MKKKLKKFISGSFPDLRLRRNRADDWVRRLVSENSLSTDDLIWPVFVEEGEGVSTEVSSMPGVRRYSIDILIKEVRKAAEFRIPAIAVFPAVPVQLKNESAEEAYNPENLICRAIRAIKKEIPEMGVISDVALDPYTSHGQDGLLKEGRVANDETIEILCKQSVVQAEAGCDIVAPSDMMDGRVAAIRKALDDKGYKNTRIMSYAAKYASGFYGPFRDAVGSAENLGKADKKTYQMDFSNSDEALREVALDIKEGADMVIIKPGMPYLDILRRIKDNFNIPVFSYQVSGEYAMLKAAVKNGWLDNDAVLYESLLSFKRAGASGVLTYAALEVAELIRKKHS